MAFSKNVCEACEKDKSRRSMMHMKKIIMFIGGVETLEYFSIQMGNAWKKKGYSVFYYDLKNEEQSAKKVRKFIKPGETVLVTFNFEGLEKEAGVYKEGMGYLWESYGIPCYNIAADHPYYYHDRLAELPKQYYHISIDRLQEAYFRDFYPEFTDRGFLPLAGTELPFEMTDAAETEITAGSGEEKFRNIDVIMTGNYTPPSFCEPYIHWINDEYAAFYQGIIDDLLANPGQTVEEAALRHCEREMGKEPNDLLRIALHKMIFIDLYVRNYWRGEVVRTLVDSGITVDVFGKGWEELECANPKCLIIHPQTTSLECLKQIQRSKVSVNVMPWFKDGAHDRVFNSILNGAVCVSDRSNYLCEELKEGEGICYYELGHLGTLPELVQSLLTDDRKRQKLVETGKKKVRAAHTWENRAEQLLTWIEEDGY